MSSKQKGETRQQGKKTFLWTAEDPSEKGPGPVCNEKEVDSSKYVGENRKLPGKGRHSGKLKKGEGQTRSSQEEK